VKAMVDCSSELAVVQMPYAYQLNPGKQQEEH
jgi:hypothetical protein